MTNLNIPITDLDPGSVQGTDEYPAVDVQDTTQADAGTTKKYTIAKLFNYIAGAIGLNPYASCKAATTANLNATYNNGTLGVNATLTNAGVKIPLVLDGVSLDYGDRVLVKDQTSGANNGIYTVSVVGDAATNWVLRRSSDCNQVSNIINNATVLITDGTTNADTFWQLQYTGILVVGTTVLNWTEFDISPDVFFTWNVVTGTSQAISENNGYVPTNVTRTDFSLPATADVGDHFIILGNGSGGFRITQGAGQYFQVGSVASTPGITGYIESTNRFDSVDVYCLEANNVFTVRPNGNLIIV